MVVGSWNSQELLSVRLACAFQVITAISLEGITNLPQISTAAYLHLCHQLITLDLMNLFLQFSPTFLPPWPSMSESRSFITNYALHPHLCMCPPRIRSRWICKLGLPASRCVVSSGAPTSMYNIAQYLGINFSALWIIGSSKLPDVFWDLDAYSIVSIKKRSNMQDKISRKGVSLYRKEDRYG